jgi:hypothetical protein
MKCWSVPATSACSGRARQVRLGRRLRDDAPLRGPLNNSRTDHATDAWDTIDWLVKNVPESNGKVGMIGSSYEGYTVLMALIDPHRRSRWPCR